MTYFILLQFKLNLLNEYRVLFHLFLENSHHTRNSIIQFILFGNLKSPSDVLPIVPSARIYSSLHFRGAGFDPPLTKEAAVLGLIQIEGKVKPKIPPVTDVEYKPHAVRLYLES